MLFLSTPAAAAGGRFTSSRRFPLSFRLLRGGGYGPAGQKRTDTVRSGWDTLHTERDNEETGRRREINEKEAKKHVKKRRTDEEILLPLPELPERERGGRGAGEPPRGAREVAAEEAPAEEEERGGAGGDRHLLEEADVRERLEAVDAVLRVAVVPVEERLRSLEAAAVVVGAGRGRGGQGSTREARRRQAWEGEGG